MSKAITEQRDERIPGGAALAGGPGPSIQVEDEPAFARICALFGAFCVVVGGVALYIGLFTTKTLPWPFTPFWMSLLLTVGCIALLFHAAYDRHVEFRRVYQFIGLACLVGGAVLCFLPYSAGTSTGHAGDLLAPGVVFLSLGLALLLFTLRNETEVLARNWLQLLLLAAGSVLAVIGLFGGNLSNNFLTPVGLVLALVGLLYLLAFVGARGTSDDLAYRTGLVIGAVGGIVFFVALWRSSARFPIFELIILLGLVLEVGSRVAGAWGYLSPEARLFRLNYVQLRAIARVLVLLIFFAAIWLVNSGWIHPASQPFWADYVVPQGVLLMGMGLIYVCTSYLICSDRPLAVLTRRELAAFIYSPVAYFLLFGSGVFAAWSFWLFALPIYYGRELGPMFEPIVKNYMAGNNFLAVICAIGVVPALTMRLFSEEKRSGTLEVLLTAPVSDFAVIMSKFLAALLMFLIVWLPFGVYLIALRLGAGKDFDYRPLLSFFVAMLVSGANFVGMGLFFSCLTRNQIVSFILSLIGMLTFFCIYFGRLLIQIKDAGSVWETVLQHMSYHDLWSTAMEGQLQPKFLLFPASLTLLWLFMTAKVLEIRKWS